MSIPARFLLAVGFVFIIEFYVYQAFKSLVSHQWARIGYWFITLLVYGIIIYLFTTFNRAARDHHQIQLLVSIFMIFLLPKLFASLFLGIGDILRIIEFGIQNFTQKTPFFPERRKFIRSQKLVS